MSRLCNDLVLYGRQVGMELLSLHGAEELTFVQSLVTLATTTTRYHFGAQVENRIWLGLQKTLEGKPGNKITAKSKHTGG